MTARRPGAPRSAARRDPLLALLAATAGIGIAYLDSRPGWDATAITAGLLLLTAAVVAAVSGWRPWLWAALVGIWTPLVEVALEGPVGLGSPLGSVAALIVAAIGATLGWALARWARRLAPSA